MKYIVTVRGMLKGGADRAHKVHDEIVSKVTPQGKAMGNTSHQAYLDVQDANQFFAIAVWDNLESIQKLYSNPSLGKELARMFADQPPVNIWADSGWLQF